MCHCQSSLLALCPFKAEYFLLCFWFQFIRLHELSLIQIYKAMLREGNVIFLFLFSSSSTRSAYCNQGVGRSVTLVLPCESLWRSGPCRPTLFYSGPSLNASVLEEEHYKSSFSTMVKGLCIQHLVYFVITSLQRQILNL